MTIPSPTSAFSALLADERGQTLVEYALILSFVSIVGLVLSPIGQWVAAALTQITSDL